MLSLLIKNAPIWDWLKIFLCNAIMALLFEAIALAWSSWFCILNTPSRQFSSSLPLSLTPPKILFWMVLPSASLAIPILLEKKGMASLLPPKFPKRSLLSIKNCRFSGSEISNRVRLVIILSTSTFEKSGFRVISKLSPFPTAIFKSPPKTAEFDWGVPSKLLDESPLM